VTPIRAQSWWLYNSIRQFVQRHICSINRTLDLVLARLRHHDRHLTTALWIVLLDRKPENALWAEYFGSLRAPYEDPFEPVNDMVYPIVNKLDQIGKDAPNDPTSHEIVGLLATSFYWRDMICRRIPMALSWYLPTPATIPLRTKLTARM
jgi:hypothetical protein